MISPAPAAGRDLRPVRGFSKPRRPCMITPMKQTEYIIGPNDQNRRLDRILKIAFPRRSPGDLYKALRKGLILVNGRKTGPETRLTEGDRLIFKGILAEEMISGTGTPAPISHPELTLPLLWQNHDLICLNKPRGQLVHGPDSLEIQVRAYLAERIEESLAFTPGPLHRLDRNTTGLVMFSRSLRGAQAFTEKLRNHRLVKLYLAVLEGHLTAPQLWEDPLLRREGVTIRDPP
jgi:23S rRNA pseudouridine955/2504/2580 synthase